MKIKTNATRGAFTAKDLLTALAVIFMALVVLLPLLARMRAKSSRPGCQNNVKQIGLAVRTWEGDFGDRYPMTVPISEGGSMGSIEAFRSFKAMSNELNNPKIVVCPNDKREAATSFEVLNNANVSYFVGLDADERFPHMILSGDRNLMTNGVAVGTGLAIITSNTPLTWSTAMHNGAGNVGLADGSVQQADNAYLQTLFQQSGTNVNRLAGP